MTRLINKDGVAEITFNTDNSSFEIMVTRLDDSGSEVFDTHSENFVLIDASRKVINLFSYILDGQDIDGVSTGQFTHSSGNNLIDTYTGRIVTFHNNEIIRQKGSRIPKTEIATYQNNYGNNWKQNYIDQKSTSK